MSKLDQLKQTIATMIKQAGSGHYASSMSALEIMYPLFYEQGVKPDEFVLSKGHAAPALYAILYDLGYLKDGDMVMFRYHSYPGWRGLPGHPSLETPGVLCSSGSLGMGISKAIGLAYANPDTIYHVLVGDGELQEGQNWEAMQYLYYNVDNVRVHVDCNCWQYSGYHMYPEMAKEFGLMFGGNPNVLVHYTTWDHDNSYLCAV